MTKYSCEYSEVIYTQLRTCKINNNETCKFQQYCPKDHEWYNSELYNTCEYRKKEKEKEKINNK